MFIPLHDSVALKYIRRAAATMTLLGITALTYIATVSGLFGSVEKIDLGLGLIPSVLLGSAIIGPDIIHVPAWFTLISYIFVHNSIWHLVANMLFLWVFGDNVEDAMGSYSFAAFYILSGVGAGVTYALLNANSQLPLIGASGAISGVAVAYVLLYPRARIVGLLLNILPVSLSAGMILSIWITYQLAAAFLAGDSHVGWSAHAGGIISGALLLLLFKRRDVPWFGQRTQ